MKPMSWKMTIAKFAWMVAVALGGSLAFNATLRHELLTFHSDMWQLVIPADLAATAILAIGMRFAFNAHTRCVVRGSLESYKDGV